MTGAVELLERLMTRHGAPGHVRSDNGPEFVANALQEFLADGAIGTLFIAPGAPWQNPFAETFHARLRDELLDQELFATVLEARIVIDQWRRYDNDERPHGALNDNTPSDAIAARTPSTESTATPTP